MEKLSAPGVSYDCVLTDNSMPRMTGIEALRKIRENENFRNLPVIVLTGDVGEDIVNEVVSLGAVYMNKSSKKEKLFAEIERISGVGK